MMLSAQAARMGCVQTTLRKIGCSASNKLTFSLVKRGCTWFPPSSSSHFFSGRPRLAREQYHAVVGIISTWNRNKSTAASAKHHDFEDEKDDAAALSIIENNEALYQQYSSAAEAATTTTTTTDAIATSLQKGGAAPVLAHLPDAAAVGAWMINLGRNDDNEWLTGPRGREWFTGVHPRECPGMFAPFD